MSLLIGRHAVSPSPLSVRGEDDAPSRVTTGLLLSLYLVLFCLQSLETLREDRTPKRDAEQYVTIAYNIVHHGAFSLSPERPEEPPSPTMHRAPAYPFFLALGIWASPELRSLDMDEFFEDESQPRLWPLRRAQLLLVLLVSFLAMALAWELTRSRPLAFLTLGLVGLDRALVAMSGNLLSETLACFLLTTLSLCLALTVRTLRTPLFGLSGASLAALALTRPAYAYLGMPLVGLFCLLWLKRPAERRKLRAGILLFLVCFVAPVGAWMGRNVYQFSKAGISDGAGKNLDIRSRLNLMTSTQYLASLLYWSNSRYMQEMLERHFDDETVVFLDESSPEGAYQQAYARAAELIMEHGSTVADTLQQAEAIERILNHPWRHIYVTIPIALRGIYVHGIVLSVLLFSCLLGGFAIGCLRRDPVCLAALLPSVFSFAFHAFLTQNIPRFSQPLIPILCVALAMILSTLQTHAARGTVR